MIPEVEGQVIKGHHAVVYQDRVMSFQSGERAREKNKKRKTKNGVSPSPFSMARKHVLIKRIHLCPRDLTVKYMTFHRPYKEKEKSP